MVAPHCTSGCSACGVKRPVIGECLAGPAVVAEARNSCFGSPRKVVCFASGSIVAAGTFEPSPLPSASVGMTEAERFLGVLAAALHNARGRRGLLAATEPAAGSGIGRVVEEGSLRVGGRVLRSPLPRVTLQLASVVDAAVLADAWEIECPIAVSGDVNQATWRMAVRGSELIEPHGRRVVAEDVVMGCWAVSARLNGRPRRDLPDVSAGASPVYDLRECREVVRSISVERVTPRGRVTGAGDPAAVHLLDAARARNPYARPGWAPPANSPFVVIEANDAPVAGAALVVERMSSLARASAFALDSAIVEPDARVADLIDVLEAVAFDSGAGAIRFDGTAFLLPGSLELAQRGYTIGPPYDGDTDVDVWADYRFDG